MNEMQNRDDAVDSETKELYSSESNVGLDAFDANRSDGVPIGPIEEHHCSIIKRA